MTTKWGGRKVYRLLAAVLETKGSVCHLCGEPGANSPDHDPPRIELIRLGVPDPDALVYLFPSHRLCNYTRNDRPVTAALRAECRAKFLAATGTSSTGAAASLSPRFAARRPAFESDELHRKASLPVSPRGGPGKTGAARNRRSGGRS